MIRSNLHFKLNLKTEVDEHSGNIQLQTMDGDVLCNGDSMEDIAVGIMDMLTTALTDAGLAPNEIKTIGLWEDDR